MAKKEKVCNNDFDDLDILDFKKTITSLNFELENAKNEYEIVIDKKKLISGAKCLSKDR